MSEPAEVTEEYRELLKKLTVKELARMAIDLATCPDDRPFLRAALKEIQSRQNPPTV